MPSFWETRLEQVRSAISEILLTGASISDDGSSLSRADLGNLREMEREAELRVSLERSARDRRGRNRVWYTPL